MGKVPGRAIAPAENLRVYSNVVLAFKVNDARGACGQPWLRRKS